MHIDPAYGSMWVIGHYFQIVGADKVFLSDQTDYRQACLTINKFYPPNVNYFSGLGFYLFATLAILATLSIKALNL